MLSVDCPSVCGATNFCVFYPPASKGNCTERYGLTSCYDGDVCTFECLTTWGNADTWFISVFDNDDSFMELDAENSAYKIPSVLVNASVVTKLDAFDQPNGIAQLCVFILCPHVCECAV